LAFEQVLESTPVEKKAELGTKRICPSCAARFYDLGKRPIICPKCQTSFEPETLLRPRRQRPEPREAPVPKPVKEEEEEVLEDEDTDADLEDDGEEVLEDEALEPEDEEAGAPGKSAGPAKRRTRAPAVVEDDIVLPDGEDEDVDLGDEEEDVLVESDEDLEDDPLVEIDPDLEDDDRKGSE
jgi:uncharacterized protein (TIGR02300 family)